MRPDMLHALLGLGLVALLASHREMNHTMMAMQQRLAALEDAAVNSANADAPAGTLSQNAAAKRRLQDSSCASAHDVAVLAIESAYAVSEKHELLAAQLAELESSTGQAASGMAIPQVDPTPAIVAATVASIDESADTVTLAQIDASVAAGQALQLSDAAGQTCAAAPKGQDLTVLSVSGASVSFSTDITSGDASANTNCVLSRAESYDLPACEAGDPPAVIYTRDPGLDIDVLMTCSEMGGLAAWRHADGAVPVSIGFPDASTCTAAKAGSLAFATAPDRSEGDMLVCQPGTLRWGYLRTDVHLIETQADYDAWRSEHCVGGKFVNWGFEVDGNQHVRLHGNVLANPLLLSEIHQSLTVRGARALGSPPEWRSAGDLYNCGDGVTNCQRRAFRVQMGKLTLEYITVVGWISSNMEFEGYGGAIYVGLPGQSCRNLICSDADFGGRGLFVKDVRFVDNMVTGHYVMLHSGPSCYYSEAEAWEKRAGAIYISATTDVPIKIINSDFVNNFDDGRPGSSAIYWDSLNLDTQMPGNSQTFTGRCDPASSLSCGTIAGSDCSRYASRCSAFAGRCLENGLAQNFYWEPE
eukprot:COSAG02_NODE_3096_length_7380_cov_36.086910_4_plen_585_part_00